MTVNLTVAGGHLAANVFTFGLEDYVVFLVMLGVSTGIGVYFGFFAHGSDTTDEYLLGGKRMKTLPIAISLVASQLSGLAVMAMPAEVYAYGVNYVFSFISMFAVIPMLCFVVIPVFYNNNISNCYEYLQMRFNKQTRQIITVTFILSVFLYLPVVIFVPSLAFSQVTGMNIHLINATVCSICVLYTMLGGIKAVVWTDVVQGAVMVGSSVLIAVMGVVRTGGLEKVIEYATNGERLHPNLQFDLQTRATIWNCLSGGFCMWSSYIGFNQSCVQRIVALPSLTRARRSLYIFGVGFFIIMLLNSFTGIIIFAKYHDCDPIATKMVEKADKIVPFFVQDIVGNWKGMPGVFISCVFSASLSTISANLNSLSGIFYFDYVKPFVRHTETRANYFMKSFVVVIGIYCVCGGFIVQHFKSIMQVMITVSGVTHGVVFGIFILGLLAPRVNAKVALFSLVASMVAMVIVIGGAQMKIQSGELSYEPLPTWTDGCESGNETLSRHELTKRNSAEDEEFSVFKISFYWYALMGGLFVWGIAIPLSYVFPSTEKVDPKLLSPIIRPWVEETSKEAEAQPLRNLKQ